MHLEVQIALNFVISYLYNKLPRRRVDIFGEELAKVLHDKFQGHWYPDKPYKGSAYRCLKSGDNLDPTLEFAARESGMSLQDLRNNLPNDFSLWIDPGEVSYRVGEKNPIIVLYSEKMQGCISVESVCSKEVESSLSCSLSTLKMNDDFRDSDANPDEFSFAPINQKQQFSKRSRPPSPALYPAFKSSGLIFTTASFAQTKFGSTKLKNNFRKSTPMSPVEFSQYIKQRKALQHLDHGRCNVSSSHVISPTQHNLFMSFFPYFESNGAQDLRSVSPLSYATFSNPQAGPSNRQPVPVSSVGTDQAVMQNCCVSTSCFPNLYFSDILKFGATSNQCQHLLVAN